MKKNLFRLVAVLTAFFIGVAINNSCGDTQKDSANPTTQELWTIVRSLAEETAQLKTEVQQLRGKVDALEGGGTTGGDNSGEFLADGLYFSRNGMVSSKPKKVTSGQTTSTYTYDDKGRLQSSTTQANGYTATTSWKYSGKTSTYTYTTTSDSSITTSITEHY